MITDPYELMRYYKMLCEKHRLTGRTLIAEEGINGTLEGKIEDTEAFLREFLCDTRFSGMQIKRSKGYGDSFPKCMVKVKKEIVGTRFPKEIDPTKKTGTCLQAEELHNWYESGKDFVVVDMRNSYEYASGHFKGSLNPEMDASRELPEKMAIIKEVAKDKTILAVCTGGVRCEKMSAYLMHEGLKDVYQLEGGIHSYMEKYPGKNFLGTLFTFDNRLVMDFGGEREVVGRCKRCNKKNEQYQNCTNANCNMLFLICNECTSSCGAGFCSSTCEKSTARVISRMRS